MMAQNHLLMGAIIGIYIKNPYLVALLAVISHFIMDLFPFFIFKGKSGETTKHYYRALSKDIKYLTHMMVELQIVTVIFVFIVLYQTNQLFLRNVQLGMLFAIFPDILKQIMLFFKIDWKHHKLFVPLHRDNMTIIHTITTIILLAILILG